MTWSMLSPTVNPKHQTVGAALVTCEHDKTCSVAMCEIWVCPVLCGVLLLVRKMQ